LNTITEESPLSPAAAEAYFELGSIALMQGNLDEAEKIITELSNSSRLQFDKKNNALYKLARICFYQSKFDKARDILSKVLTNLKDNSANDALELSLILNSSMNDSINISRFAEAEFLAEQKKFSEAAMIYNSIAENPQAFVLHSISLLRLGEMKLADDNYPEAVSTFEDIAEEGEKNIYADKAVYLLGKIHQFGIKDKLKAEEYYQKLLAEYPDSIYADDARQQLKILMKNSS
jgi:TolA-binding protein